VILRKLFKEVEEESFYQELSEKLNKKVSFVQVGANDGESNDLISQYAIPDKWEGVLIEPVPHLYEKLVERYKSNEHIECRNIALSDHEGSAKFYFLDVSGDEDLPSWADEVGSFHIEIIKKHKAIPNLEERIRSIDVKTQTFESMLKDTRLSKVDLILIDTEGHDYMVLKTINLKKIKPKVIVWEHIHLSKMDKLKSILKTKCLGYKIYLSGNNIIGVKDL
jgi:FkbM family methyltransferase